MRIRAGSSYRETGGTVINVESYLIHPDFNKLEFLDADVALLRLEQALVYGPGIQPIAIYAQGVEVPDNSAVVHAGWGQTQVSFVTEFQPYSQSVYHQSRGQWPYSSKEALAPEHNS